MVYYKAREAERRQLMPHSQASGDAENQRLAQGVMDAMAKRSEVAAQTEQYWQVTVAALHKLRFDAPANANEKGMPDLRHLVEETKAALSRAQVASPANVDPELVAMAQRHLKLDQVRLDWGTSVLKILDDPKIASERKAAMERITVKESQSQLLDDAANPNLPDNVKQLLDTVVLLGQNQLEMSREIDIMQAKLQERYRADKRSFSLPEVRQ